MRFEIENFFDLSTIHGLKYLSKKFHWIERFFWSLSLFISIILTIYLITELFINLNHDPVITHIADHQVPITDIDFPAITVCLGQEHVIPYYYEKFKYYKRLSHIKYSDKKIFKDFADEIKYFKYMNYAAILDEIAKGYFDVDKLGLKILKRLQVIDILTKRGILSQLNISIPTDDFLDVLSEFQRANIREILPLFHWSRDYYSRYSIILTEFGLCRSFNLALPEDIFYIDSISDDFLHNYFTDSDYNGQKNNTEIIPRKAENSDDSVNFWTGGKPRETEVFKFEGYMIFYHDPYEMPKRNTKALIINVQETHIMNLFFTPEMVDIDQSLYDVDPFDRNCYFDDERKLNLFKVYTKANCESECLTNFMIKKCDCAEYFMIQNCTTRICSAIDKNCIDKAYKNFERQKSQCKCLPQCTYVKFDVKRVDGSGGIKEQYNINNEQKSANIFIKFLKSSFPRFVRKQNFDFIQFLSFVGGLLGLFAGFSMISAVEIFYWFLVRIFTKKFIQKSTEVHPFNEIIEKKSKIFKEYFGNSSIHGLNYGINTNLIEKLFWTFFVTLSITFCIIMAFDIKIQKRIVHEDNTNFRRKIPFPAVTFIPSYFIDNEFDVNFKDETDYEKFVRRLENKKFKEKIQKITNKFSGCKNFLFENYYGEEYFSTKSTYVEAMHENSPIDWFQQQFALWNNKFQVNFTQSRTLFGLSYTFNLMDTEKVLRYKNVNDEFKLKRNVSMLNQKSMPKMSKNQYPLKVGVNDRSKFQLHIDESKFNLKQLQRCVLRMIVVHSTDYFATFLDLKEFIDVEKSMNIEIVSEFTKTEESLKSQSPKELECYFENERKLKYFKIYSQKHCEMECSMDRLFEEHKCQMVDIIYKERRNFCLEIMHDEKRGILQKDNCSCLPSCNLLTYHVKYFPIESEGNESIITVTMNGEDFILYRRYQLFTFSDIVSYVGGLLGLFAGISVLSIIEIFYYLTLRLGNDVLLFCKRFNE